eukprot:gene15245-23283_t
MRKSQIVLRLLGDQQQNPDKPTQCAGFRVAPEAGTERAVVHLNADAGGKADVVCEPVLAGRASNEDVFNSTRKILGQAMSGVPVSIVQAGQRFVPGLISDSNPFSVLFGKVPMVESLRLEPSSGLVPRIVSAVSCAVENQAPDMEDTEDYYPIKFAFCCVQAAEAVDMLQKDVFPNVDRTAQWGEADFMGSRYIYAKKFADLSWMINKPLQRYSEDDTMAVSVPDLTMIVNVCFRMVGKTVNITLMSVSEKHMQGLRAAFESWPAGGSVRRGEGDESSAPISKALSRCHANLFMPCHPFSVTTAAKYYQDLARCMLALRGTVTVFPEPPADLTEQIQKLNDKASSGKASSLVAGVAKAGLGGGGGGGGGGKWGKLRSDVVTKDKEIDTGSGAATAAARLLISAGKKHARTRGEEKLETEVMKLRQETAESNMRLGALNRDLQQRGLDITRLQDDLESKIRQIQSLNAELDEMTKQRDEFKQEVEEIDIDGFLTRIKELEAERDLLLARLADLQKRVDRLEAEKAELQQTYEQALKRIRELELGEEAWRREQASWERDRTALQAEIAALKQKLALGETDHTRRIDQLTAELEQQKRRNAELEAALEKMRKEKDDSDRELASEQAKRKGFLDEIERLKRVGEELGNERDRLKTDNAGLKADLDHVKRDKLAVEGELEKLKHAYKLLQQSFEKLDREKSALQAAFDALKAQHNDLAARLAQKEKECISLQ